MAISAVSSRPVTTDRAAPVQFNKNDPRFSVQLQTPRVVIHADGGPLDPALAAKTAQYLTAAMDSHIAAMGWGQEAGIRKPMQVYVVSAALMKAYGYGVGGGVAFDGDTFIMSRLEARGAEPGVPRDYAFNTEGHEVFHALQRRVDPQQWNPSYFYEGLACTMSNRFASKRLGTVDWLGAEAGAAAKWTPEQAKLVLAHMRSDDWGTFFDNPKNKFDSWDAELLGALAVEFYRSRYGQPGEAGFRQLGGVSLDISKGMTFEQAFQHQFNVPLKTAEAAFVTFIGNTANAPAKRLAGTSWAP